VSKKCTGRKISINWPEPLTKSKSQYDTGNAKIGPGKSNYYESKRVMLVPHKNNLNKCGSVSLLTRALLPLLVQSRQFVFSLLLRRMFSVVAAAPATGSVATCTCPSGLELPDYLDLDPVTELTPVTIDFDLNFNLISFRPENKKIVSIIFKDNTHNFRSIKSSLIIYWIVGPGSLYSVETSWVRFSKIGDYFCMYIRIRRG
jgi:hypothetical protein